MTTQIIRNEVWQNYLDASRLARYYSVLADRHKSIYMLSRAILILPLLTGVALLFDLLPEILVLFVGLVIVLLVVTDLMFDFAKRASVLKLVSQECGSLENEYRDLWLAVENGGLSDGEVRERVNQIEKKMIDVTNRLGSLEIRVDHKLNEKCAIETYEVMADRYEHST